MLRKMIAGTIITTTCACTLWAEDAVFPAAKQLTYPIVDTNQDRCFSDKREITYPLPGSAYYGQDAQYRGASPSYIDNKDGTVSDLNTGLMWVKTPNLKNPISFSEAKAGAKTCRVGGYDDWRMPTIKELYSLIDFSGYSMQTAKQSKPYIDTRYFDFVFGDTAGNRLIDAQYLSSTEYVGLTMGGRHTVFGVNFADGRIKGYPSGIDGGRVFKRYIRYVRGNPEYGINKFNDNGNSTITDEATNLMWAKVDSGKAMNWKEALAYAENLTLGGYDDWRLPNAKELHSIVDYTRAPDAKAPHKRGPAIDPIFQISETESWFWTGTTHLEHLRCSQAAYFAFGQAYGNMHGQHMNVHGAGAQRSDPKSGDPERWSGGHGPQGDDIRIYNYVRCVRGGDVKKETRGPALSSKFISGSEVVGQGQGQGSGGMGSFVGRLDKNGDGKVSKSEFDGPKNHFSHIDSNHDGYISEEEAKKLPPPGQRPRR